MSATGSPAARIRTVIATCSPVNADGRPTCRPRIRAASRAAEFISADTDTRRCNDF